jgi:protein SCO1/2
MNRRRRLAALGLSLWLVACGRELTFQMTRLDPPRPTQDFVLTDQFGRQVHLSDFRGRVVVLTFLYTGCADVCPLVAERLRESRDLLGQHAGRTVFLVVTVDPETDTVAQLKAYSEAHGMQGVWRFLTGTRAELEPVWQYYWVGPVSKDAHGAVTHQAPVHLIDQAGRVRAVSGQTVRPAELAHDVEALLRAGPAVAGGHPGPDRAVLRADARVARQAGAFPQPARPS